MVKALQHSLDCTGAASIAVQSSLEAFVVLYNILLPINHYIGSFAMSSVILQLPVVISSDLWVIASTPSITSDLLDISNPHEYADICY